jgi:hypothetical protein
MIDLDALRQQYPVFNIQRQPREHCACRGTGVRTLRIGRSQPCLCVCIGGTDEERDVDLWDICRVPTAKPGWSPDVLRIEALTTLADAYEQQQRDLAEAAGLLREGQSSIVEHQWAIRMLTESATPEALSLGKLKTKGDNVWCRMKAWAEKYGGTR